MADVPPASVSAELPTVQDAPAGFTAVPFGADLPSEAVSKAGAVKRSGTFANIGAGSNEGIASILGAPVDALNAVITHTPDFLGGPAKPIGGGSEFFKSALGLVGSDPRQVETAGEGDKIARAAGSGLASMVVPGVGAEALLAKTSLGATPGLAQDAARLFASGATPGGAIAGASGGAAGEAASSMVPDTYKPVANLVGNLVGGAVPLVAGAVMRKAGDVALGNVKRWAQPFQGEAGAERAATESLRAKLGEPGTTGTLDAIESEAAPLVEGSEPTLAAVTQNPGVSQLQIGRQDVNSPAYLARKDAQAAAQKAAIEGTAPAEANPAALPAALEQQRADRIAKGQSNIAMAQDLGDEATQAAREGQESRLGALTDQHAAQAEGSATANAAAVDAARQAAEEQAAAAAQARDEALAQTGASDASNQELGAQQRGELAGARKAQAGPASAKFQAVDPEGKLALEIPSARETVAKTIADMGEADALTPEEERLYSLIQRTPVKKYKDVQSIDSALGNAVRAARANPLEANAARRMGDVLSALREDVTGATGLSPAEIEAEMAARGVPPHPAPKDMAAVTPPAAEKAGTVALDRAGLSAPEGQNQAITVNVGPRNERGFEGSGREGPGGANALDAGKPTELGTGPRESGAGNGRLNGAAEGQGTPSGGAQANGAETQGPLAQNFPPEALDRWLDAKAAWKALKETFDRGPVGRILAKGGNGEPYKVSDSSVMDAFWRGSGAKPEDVSAVANALGGDASKLKSAFSYVANDLRKSAVKPGTNELSETAYARWLDKHGAALKVLDGLSESPQLREKFETLAGAQRVLNETRAAGEAAVKETVTAGAEKMKALSAAQKQEMGAAKVEEVGKVRAADQQAKIDNREMVGEHQSAMDKWQKSYAGQFLDDRDPQQGMQKILKSGIGSPTKLTEALTELGQRTAFDKDARAGLQKMIADELSNSLTDANGWIKPDTFRKFVSNNQVGLRKVFSPDQLRNLDAVAADLERNANVDRLAKINVGPTTGSRFAAQGEARGHGGAGNSVLGYFLGEHLGETLGEHLGIVGKILGQVVGVAGQAAMGHKLDVFNTAKGEVLDKMLLNPEFAKTMLMKYSPAAEPMIVKRLGPQLKRVGLGAALSANRN
jgi:hypothetical protein